MILESICVGPLQVNCYIIAAAEDAGAVIIDPGDEEPKIRKALDKHRLTPACVIDTHGHIDHIGCNDSFGVPIYIHSLDVPMLKDPVLNFSGFLGMSYRADYEVNELRDGQILSLACLTLEVLHTPGHTPGGICLLMKSPQKWILFSGDTLFFHSVGRADFPGSDEALLISSIREKLLTLPPETAVYPGHGPTSTIKEERRSNPFLH